MNNLNNTILSTTDNATISAIDNNDTSTVEVKRGGKTDLAAVCPEAKHGRFAAKQTGGKVKSFFSALNAKRKKMWVALTTALTMSMMSAVTAFADDAGLGGDAGEAQFNAVITFFALWIGRIGLVVGFIGAIMFALAIKNDDADAKTRGLMTLASGFVVFAVTQALSLFGITA